MAMPPIKSSSLYLLAYTLLLVIFGYLFFDGWFGVKSILFGQIAWLFPTLCLLLLYRYIIAISNIKKMVLIFFVLEFARLILSAGLIILILLTCTIHRLGFLCGYVLTIGSVFVILRVG